MRPSSDEILVWERLKQRFWEVEHSRKRLIRVVWVLVFVALGLLAVLMLK